MKPTNPEPILLVDDDTRILDSLTRQHRTRFNLSKAEGGEAALELMKSEGPFAVVVSDYKMPGMNGITLLGEVRDRHPETVRIMLTGEAQLEVAVNAVNQGRIFRFLNKPCEKDDFAAVLEEALAQYRLRQAEKVLLEHTVRGSIQVLSDILSIVNPAAFGRANRIKYFVSHLARAAELEDPWMYETAALLCLVGCVAIPGEIIDIVAAGGELSPDQREMYQRHPATARDLLGHIPRLEPVAEMIAGMFQTFGEQPEEAADEAAHEILIGSQILAVAHGFEGLVHRGVGKVEALKTMSSRKQRYNPRLLRLLESIEMPDADSKLVSISFDEIRVGMTLEEDVVNHAGMLLVAHGQEVSNSMLARLQNYLRIGQISGTLRVRMQVARCEARDPVLK